ncbi:MAG: hypothetical protein AB1512_06410 [Thermodesulfobacteriota bacterium]
MKRLLFGGLAALCGIVGFLVLAEVVLRFLPVNEGLRLMPVNEKNPVFHFTPNRTVTWSEGWNFRIVNKVHVNNDGFVNDQDYAPSARSPLLAVIGDSYIEAGIVPYDQTVQGRLAQRTRRGRVYSFAASGAGLSQYLIWARHARDRYRPGAYVFVIIGNDFSESLYHRERSPGFHHFERLPDGSAVMRRVDYEPALVRRLFRESALAMYLITNMKVQGLVNFNLQAHLGAKDRRWVANIPAQEPEAVIQDYQWAVDRFLDFLPEATGVGTSRVILVLDGFRPHMYNPGELKDTQNSVWAKMRGYVKEEAIARGVTVIDMHPLFMARFSREGRQFEFPTDAHWNGEGHRAVADAIADTEVFRSLFGERGVSQTK